MYHKLKLDIMKLEDILRRRATSGGDSDENEFEKLREEIISQEELHDYIPDFLFTNRTLYEFWDYIKPTFSTYAERRRFLKDEFNPLLSYLEEKKRSEERKQAFEYEVALSFAGEEREYVEKVAEYLNKNGVKVFYDESQEEEAKMWGVDLTEYLYGIYAKKARYCVMFISKNYAEKVWTRHEKRSALERAIKEKLEYILPARFDDTEIQGLPSTFKYVDLRIKTPEQVGNLVLMKLGKS